MLKLQHRGQTPETDWLQEPLSAHHSQQVVTCTLVILEVRARQTAQRLKAQAPTSGYSETACTLNSRDQRVPTHVIY